jgi:hypothetical protein
MKKEVKNENKDIKSEIKEIKNVYSKLMMIL